MGFQYNNLWTILEQKNMTKDELRFKIRCSPTTLIKMQNNGNISLDVIDRICDELGCLPSDIMEYVPKERPLKLTIERKKGDIFIIDLPPFRDSTDEENVRLGLIFQNDAYLDQAPSILTIPLSSHISLNSITKNVIIQPDPSTNNFQYPFAVQISDMRMLRKVHLKEKYGSLSNSDIEFVNEAVKQFIDL